MKRQFRIPGAKPSGTNIPLDTARKICENVAIDHLNRDCVFDVATTGDESLAKAYLAEQDLKLHGSSVQILADRMRTRPGEPVMITATLLPLRSDGPRPAGTVTFVVDGVPAGPPVKTDDLGRASFRTDRLERGDHLIRAAYGGGGRYEHRPSSSPSLLHTVGEDTEAIHMPEMHGGHA